MIMEAIIAILALVIGYLWGKEDGVRETHRWYAENRDGY